MKRIILIVALAVLVTAPAAFAQNRPEKPAERPYAARTYSPYSNESVRRERGARATAKAIREDERRERSRYRYSRPARDDRDDYEEDDD